MESFCRGCLSKYDPIELTQYSEKIRRLFVYSTGIQVKRNDVFIFQLCKDCCINMKAACSFKKNCRNSDKKIKSYMELKESDDNIEFSTFFNNTEDTIKLRLPLNIGNSTPVNQKGQDDDNESTCTSIQNFMTGILEAEEIPDSEARFIEQVIKEETDILEDSLESHWLQDDVSVDSDYRLDFSFSPFSTPHSVNDNQLSPIKHLNDIQIENQNTELLIENLPENNVEDMFTSKTAITLNDNDLKNEFNLNIMPKDTKCVIDVNLENALKNDTGGKVLLEELLSTPPMIPNISAPSTPVITSILFGDNIDLENDLTQKENINYTSPVKELDDMNQDIDVIDEFLNINHIGLKETKDIEFDDNSLMDLDEVEDIDRYFNKSSDETAGGKDIKRSPSPIESKYCITNFYCKMCNRQFKNLVALKVHCTIHHKFKIEKPKTKRIRKPYICDFCGQLFTSSRCILKHLERHQTLKTYECKKCTLTFKTEAAMKLHESSHTGIRIRNNKCNKKYVCSICGAVCSSASNYNIHKRRHLNNFTISCKECGKGYYRTSDLTIHMRQHTGERPYQCKYCPRTFTRQDVLSRHMKCHTGEKPYVCQFCDTKFCKAYDLKIHQSKSKLCIQRQMQIIEKETMKEKHVMEEILVTNAFVF